MGNEPPVTLAPLQVGQEVDGYRLEERTHQGGMANLWRVTKIDGGVSEPLVMKVPRMKSGKDPASIVGFEVEQMIMPALSGPHVPRFIAKADFTGQPYIVMECVAGPSLRPRLDHAPIPLDEVVQIGAKVATALHDLHRQRVIHLDVKPSNVMFRDTGEAVLIDFGMSRHDRLPDLLEEEFELPMGTGPYMSPEQVQFVRNDPRSDLFALGVMLYYFSTGERPFGAPTTVRGLRKRLYDDPVPPRALRPEMPPWLQEIILRCLEVQPGNRHQSGAQLAFDLQHREQVVLTERAERQAPRSGSAVGIVKRWFGAVGARPPVVAGGATTRSARAPILMAALDVAGADPGLLEAVRETVERLLRTEPSARLACLTVMKTNLIGADELLETNGSSKHLKLLMQLKHWAYPIVKALETQGRGDAGRVTFHVIEASDPANAIIEYAGKNQVDHVVLGARSSGGLRRYLGSVSAQVAAEVTCTVTAVRT